MKPDSIMTSRGGTTPLKSVVVYGPSLTENLLSRVRTVVATEILLVLGLLGFVGIAYGIDLLRGTGSTIPLSPLAAIALSIAPALLWLGYFHAQDRHEPEPKHYVLGVFLLGAFVAGPVSSFIVEDIVGGPPGLAYSLDRFSTERILRAFLVVGLAQETCKYLVVRYTIYLSTEFDEPMDGIIYSRVNFQYLQSR